MIALYSKTTVPDGQTQAAVASSTILTTVEIIPVGIIIMCRMILPAAIRLVEILLAVIMCRMTQPEEIRPEEIRPEEICLEEIRPEEIRLEEICPEEIRPVVISAAEEMSAVVTLMPVEMQGML